VTIPQSFLEEVRARTVLSGLVSARVKIVRKGREFEGLCPFHSEKTPSFTVSDEKGFYHCFGCGAHGDAIRWLTDAGGMGFIDAVRQLSQAAGLTMPERSPEAAKREERRAGLLPLLETAQAFYAGQLEACGAAREYLAARGWDGEACVKYGIGWAPGRSLSVRSALPGAGEEELRATGLIAGDKGEDFLWQRITIPVRDGRGRVIGFAARGLGDASPKYVNSPDGPVFDKGRTLFNLDRAAGLARTTRRLVVVEGQFDAWALDRLGIAAGAPMGSALTEAQLELAWRVANVPVLLFDGNDAGRAAAIRACERALPRVGPGRSLAIALLPEGEDPDSLARKGCKKALTAVIAAARPLDAFLFDAVMREAA